MTDPQDQKYFFFFGHMRRRKEKSGHGDFRPEVQRARFFCFRTLLNNKTEKFFSLLFLPVIVLLQ